MPRKNIALEVALVVCALLAAFLVQAFIAQTKPPKVPEFPVSHGKVEKDKSAPVIISDAAEPEGPMLRIPAEYDPNQSLLGVAPDWSRLDRYQYVVTKDEFLKLLKEVYTVGDYWTKWFDVHDDHVMVQMSAAAPEKRYKLVFKTKDVKGKQARYWRPKKAQGERTVAKPLLGVRIAIDPGHIGGEFAHLEERRFVLREGSPPVQEGNMTLTVASLLVEQLEVLGATVTLLRDTNEPVNPFSVEDYFDYAKQKLTHQNAVISSAIVQRQAAKLFYRNGEIRARSILVNHEIKPDLVLCLHFNASSQANPDVPELDPREHFHMILNGAYTKGEIANDDERLQMVLKIVQGVHTEELALSKFAAKAFVNETNLEAYQYAANSSRAVNVGDNSYLWARNLLANRLYDCPVVYYEPYLQNGQDSYLRMQMGDYQGLRYVNGRMRSSIFREYVNAVTKGLVEYYTFVEPEPKLEPELVPSLLELLQLQR